MAMTPEHWQRVSDVLAQLGSLPPTQAQELLRELERNHPDMAREVRSVWQPGSLLEEPIRHIIEQRSHESDFLDETTASFDQIHIACQSYNQSSSDRQYLELQTALHQVQENIQPTLLRNLLHVDLQRRRDRGEHPQPDEYIQQLPQFVDLVHEVFAQSTSPSLVNTPNEAPVQAPGVRFLGKYRLIRQLGKGGMGVVFEAIHVDQGHRVALKTLPILNGKSLHMFKREFRSAAEINHPNLIGLHNLESDGDYWFFTMDLIDGQDFFSYVCPNRTLAVDRLRAALPQLVSGVQALHNRGIIHRDLKPSNVMVTREGRLLVLDFGLALELENTSINSGDVAGTPTYMAPEQATGGQVGTPADWYAVGVMLYEALCGKPPFRGAIMQMLSDKQKQEAPPLITTDGLPKDLCKLAQHLVKREPTARPTGEMIGSIVSAHQSESVQMSVVEFEHILIGREEQLRALQNAYLQTKQNSKPLTVFVAGRSGEGKSALVDHFLKPIRSEHDVVVMSGRCYDRESVPFKALDSLVDNLSSYLRSLTETNAALLMPDDIGVLAQLFPVLQRVEVVKQASIVKLTELDAKQVRQRAFIALRSLMNRITRGTFVVWFVDDLQWGDAESAEALFEVLRPPEAPPLLFMGSFRSDEREQSSFLNTWKALQKKHGTSFSDQEISVGPLNPEESTNLMIKLLGQDNATIRERVQQLNEETGNNPFLLTELIECFRTEGDQFERLEVQEVFDRKLGRLPAEAKPLLDIVVVSGQALSLAEASQAAGFDAIPLATLNRMRSERLVRLLGSEEEPLIDTYHDKIRETVEAHMTRSNQCELHRSLAEVIETAVIGLSQAQIDQILKTGKWDQVEWNQDRVYDLSYHFDAAGDNRKAPAYALLAAEKSRRQYSPEVAAQQYAIAKAYALNGNQSFKYRIAEGHGEALMLLGRYSEATEILQEAFELSKASVEKSRIEGLLGEIAFKQGAMKKSIVLYSSALQRIGTRVPSSFWGISWGLIRQTCIQLWHSMLPKSIGRRVPTSERLLCIRLLTRLAWSGGFSNSPLLPWGQLAAINRAETIPPQPTLVYNYAAYSLLLHFIGWHSLATKISDKSLQMSHEMNDIQGEAIAFSLLGMSRFVLAKYQSGLEIYPTGIDAFKKTGDLWELNLAEFHLAYCHYGLGHLDKAAEWAKIVFERSLHIGDPRCHCSLYLLSKSLSGDLPFAELQELFPKHPEDIISSNNLLKGEGHWHLHNGRTKEAVETFSEAFDLGKPFPNFHVISGLPPLIKALRLYADAIADDDPKGAWRVRKRAFRLAKWAVWLSWLFPTQYAQSYRELGQVYVQRGKLKKALKCIEKSCQIAENQQATYEFAQSALIRAQLQHQLNIPGASKDIEKYERELDHFRQTVQAVRSSLRQFIQDQKKV